MKKNSWFEDIKKDLRDFLKNASKEEIMTELNKANYEHYRNVRDSVIEEPISFINWNEEIVFISTSNISFHSEKVFVDSELLNALHAEGIIWNTEAFNEIEYNYALAA